MIDLISREAACKKMTNLYEEDLKAYGADIPECFNSDRAIEALMELPSEKSTIIRCEDCKHFGEAFVHDGIVHHYCHLIWNLPPASLFDALRIEHDFCSRAKRREDDGKTTNEA